MILDTSAIVAIMLQEPDFESVLEKLYLTSDAGVGTPTMTETAIVLSARLRRDARGLLSRFVHEASIRTVPFGDAHYGTAVEAWLQFGKGRHLAGLNLGDCLPYATAKLARRPLLCTGDGFAKTDLELAYETRPGPDIAVTAGPRTVGSLSRNGCFLRTSQQRPG